MAMLAFMFSGTSVCNLACVCVFLDLTSYYSVTVTEREYSTPFLVNSVLLLTCSPTIATQWMLHCDVSRKGR